MSEEINTPSPETATEATPDTGQPKAAESPDTKQDPDYQAEAEKWKALARKHEAEKKALHEKASKFDEIEESQKTETQKAIERAEAAEAKALAIEARAIRAEVSASKGVPSDLLVGTTQEELEASADRLLEFTKSKRINSALSADFAGGSGEGAITQAKFNAMTPAEKNVLFKSDPTLYRRLAG